ncbi:MAG: miaB [Bacilli bacterium]|nr:miaB [Bacilli bacterium]
MSTSPESIDDLNLHAAEVHRPTIAERTEQSLQYNFPTHLKGSMKGKHYFIRTYGCQMNEADSEMMAGMLGEMGYAPAEEVEQADFILFNTCAVRENAESKVWGEIGRLKPLKVRNPEMIVALSGCMAQEEPVRQLVAKTYPHVDIVLGTHNIHQLPELIQTARDAQETVFEVWERAGDAIVENIPRVRADGVKAWVNIQYGCNKFCTYCIVPYTRGRERSRTLDEVVKEVEGLAAEGYKEITLLGQNVNDYGLDLRNCDFADLLTAVNNVPGIERVRFITSNPWNFSDRIIEAIASGDKICKHIHLPVQSGSNEMLRRMNRGYTREFYLELVEKIKRRIPDITLTTDLIVGFPGETEEMFQDTLDLVRTVQYDSAYTFIYSPRKGTPAMKYTDQVSDEVKKERLSRLMQVSEQFTLKAMQCYTGTIQTVLVEGESKTKSEVLQARTDSNKVVHFSGPKSSIGKLAQVKILQAGTWTLKAELCPTEVLS